MGNFWTVLQAVLPVFLVIGIGAVLRWRGWLQPDLERGIFRIVLNLLLPCFILDSMVGNEALRIPENVFMAVALGFGLCLLGALFGFGVSPLVGLRERNSKNAFAYSVSIFNYGYIAIPLAQSIFDKETLGMLFILNLGVEVSLWVFGAILLSRQTFLQGMRQVNFSVIGAIIAGTILNFTHAQEWLPQFVQTSIRFLGSPANPLAILLIGATLIASLHQFSFQTGWRTMIGGLLLRNGLLPLIFLCAAKWIPMSVELQRVLVLQAAMPAALYPLVLIKYYHGDVTTGMRVILTSTLAGLVTIPLILQFGLWFCFS